MSKEFLCFILIIQYSLNSCAIFSWTNSNCSLIFHIQTNNRLTKFPIELQGNYTFICTSREHFMIYYVITPLKSLPIGRFNFENEDIHTFVPVNTTRLIFFINQSSTIRLCAHLIDIEENFRLCREIHIGISELYQFWCLPLEIFYVCILGLLSSYFLFYHLVFIRCKKQRQILHSSPPIHRYQRTDTFEYEKVYSHMSDEE